MALNKLLIIAETNAPVSYLRVEKVVRIHERARDAEFTVHAFTDGATSKLPAVVGTQVGVIRFVGPAFDLYFSKAAMVPAKQDVYAQAYRAAKDWTAALIIKRANEAALKIDPKAVPTPLTAAQQAMMIGGIVSGSFGESLFVGASDE